MGCPQSCHRADIPACVAISASIAGAEICRYAVDDVVVRFRALTVDAEVAGNSQLAAVLRGRGDHSRSEKNEVLKAAAIQRNVLDKLPVDNGADRGIRGGKHLGAAGVASPLIRDAARLELHIKEQGLADGQVERFAECSGKAGSLSSDHIRPR